MEKVTKDIHFKMKKTTKRYFDKNFEKLALNVLTTPWIGKKLKIKKIK